MKCPKCQTDNPETATWFLKPVSDPPLRKFQFEVTMPIHTADGPAISPDGTMVAYIDQDRLWIRDLDNLEPHEIQDSHGEGAPFWSPNNDYVGYFAVDGVIKRVSVNGGTHVNLGKSSVWHFGATWGREGIIIFPKESNLYAISAQGDQPQLLTAPDPEKNEWNFYHPHLLPDDQYLAYHAKDSTVHCDLWYLPLTGDTQPKKFWATSFDEAMPQISPNGQYIAYQSNATEMWQVYIRSFPDGKSVEIVSTHGGKHPTWSGTGDELFYVAPGGDLMVVKVDTETELSIGDPEKLFTLRELLQVNPYYAKYDVASNGQQFVVVKSLDEEMSQVVVVENWFKEFKGKVPTGK